MKFSLFVARRYLFSKKRHNAINLISAISAVGVMIGSMAFILVMSVFNGFEGVVLSLFNSFYADIRITPKEGKSFVPEEDMVLNIKSVNGVLYYQEVVEETALLKYRDKQQIATLKGVADDYVLMSGVDEMLYGGDFVLNDRGVARGVLGSGIAFNLSVAIGDFQNPVEIYLPDRHAPTGSTTPAFNVQKMFPAGVFSIQQEIDSRYGIVPLSLMKSLLDYEKEVTAIELGLSEKASLSRIKTELRSRLGEQFLVRDKFEQQELLYKIIRSERWAIFAILSFILLLVIFNVVGSLTMLILEKQKDIAVLQTLGAGNGLIRRIFLIEGLQISFLGVVVGLALGGGLAWAQQSFGFIKIGQAGALVIDAYPVKILFSDFLLIFVAVMSIGWIAAWLPVRKLSGQSVQQRL